MIGQAAAHAQNQSIPFRQIVFGKRMEDILTPPLQRNFSSVLAIVGKFVGTASLTAVGKQKSP
jgi:hypothetical protein